MTTDTKPATPLYAGMARNLADLGVDTLFGLMGDANLFMADHFARHCGGRYVAATHEANAVLMALGHAQVTGKVGVATVTHGPGLTNTVTALVEGVKGTTPMLMLCGDTAVEDRENFQKLHQREFILATGAGFEQLRAPATMSEDLARAYRRAIVERRPVVLNIPVDFQWRDIDYAYVAPFIAETRVFAPDSDDLDNAVGIIAAARRPIVLAGRGATAPGARAALIRLAARTGALLATTLKARALFDGEDFDLGVFGTLSTDAAVEEIAKSDCVIAFGASLNKYTAARGSLLGGKRLVQVDQDPAALGANYRPHAGLVGDPAMTAARIVELLDLAEIPPSGVRDDTLRLRLAQHRIAPRLAREVAPGAVDIRAALLKLDAAVPADRTLVHDGGRFMVESWKAVRAPSPRAYVHTVNSACIGLGMGHAIGAAVATAGRPTLLVTGDGGFMLGGMAEFATAVREKIDLIVAVCNDGGYGAEHIQFRRKGMDPSGSMLQWPDLAPVAIALGGHGVTVRSEADMDAAAAAISARSRPLLIDIKLDPESLAAITF
jgi:acetolactate synthase-1/2/3 large subunit